MEAPLRKRNPNQPPFKESPSLELVAKYLINCLKVLPNEKCQACNLACLPVDPKVSIHYKFVGALLGFKN